MKVAVFSTQSYDRLFLDQANRSFEHELVFFEPRLTPDTVELANSFDAVCVFVNDCVNAEVMEKLAAKGVRLVALRCAGFNNVDLQTAARYGIAVVRVPAYSPSAVAEHTVGLILSLNRKYHRAYARVREGNFSLNGLIGFELRDQTIGIIGLGRIGIELARIISGFGCRLLAFDSAPSKEARSLNVEMDSLENVLQKSDIVTLHCPLTPATHHLINGSVLEKMKRGVMLINTSRGGLIDTVAVIQALKDGRIGCLGLDVYEEEEEIFYKDLSGSMILDDVFARLLTFPNVLITAHQAYFTDRAMHEIAKTTLSNISRFEGTGDCENRITAERIKTE